MLAGRYELGREIGRGGMGAVFSAQDTLLNRAVAVKQIGMVAGGGAPDLDRAEREAHLAARVNHQNVVAVFDLVHEAGAQWLVMELVDGPTLAALVTKGGPIDAAELAPVVEQVAGALAAAHDHGIVHRDVKPSNILLTRDGSAKLSDFGVARAQADASLTQTGMVTGSPAYLAPEVATGKSATAASDVWSLGATIFHALSGHAPYSVDGNILGTMYRIVHEEPPRLDGSGPLAVLVTAMMQQDPEARPSMTEVQSIAAGHQRVVAPDPESTHQAMSAFAAADPTPTTAFRPLAVPVAEASHDTFRGQAWIAGLAAAALVVAVLLASTLGADPPATNGPRQAGPTSVPAAPAADPGSEVARLEGFATDYLTAASNDPRSGFAMLTTSYQKDSGGLDGYLGFWSKVSNLDVSSVEGDAAKDTVTYTYSYDFEGERRTEDVTLRLVRQGDSFLIDGAA